jgi:hypothetical protein
MILNDATIDYVINQAGVQLHFDGGQNYTASIAYKGDTLSGTHSSTQLAMQALREAVRAKLEESVGAA